MSIQPSTHNIQIRQHITKTNKAGSTATPVLCGWAGTVIDVTRSFGQEHRPKTTKKKQAKKICATNGQTNGLTDGMTHRRTDRAGVESRNKQLKIA